MASNAASDVSNSRCFAASAQNEVRWVSEVKATRNKLPVGLLALYRIFDDEAGQLFFFRRKVIAFFPA